MSDQEPTPAEDPTDETHEDSGESEDASDKPVETPDEPTE